MENNEICKKILKELLFLGYSLKNKGTYYMVEAIYEVYLIGENEALDNIEKNIYSKLAIKYNKSVENIKSNIIKATNNMYIMCNSERIKEYFLFFDDIKPTPKLIIATILNKVKF